ncbi:hypothetical protein CHS0354_026239 [Potamilus streckersoni]|uniref:COMM domain-containing protein 3 n=1 Tax=Potamilus streckersoni TaxID=2493646 RepID=A0AAE0TG25_9BIVA|nr:hypothetical protein CHS0354_026239 [Potamilus streckersoni]
MELGQCTLEGLALAGDAAHIPDKIFQPFITRACDGVLDVRSRDAIAKDSSFQSVDLAVLKEAYAAVVTLLLEAAKNDVDSNSISSVLEDCKFTSDRIDIFSKLYKDRKPYLQILLGRIGDSCPHIVDVDWRMDYYIKNNHLEKVNQAVYLITLKTEVPGQKDFKEVQFSCTQEQLQDLVGKLRDATKSMEKASQL